MNKAKQKGGKIMPQKWWKNTVVYQVYPRSFLDTNGDGIGDIAGVTKKLDYLQNLGIGAIWLSPVFKSPQDDNGYDISDYMDIDPIFGRVADMDELIAEGRKRDIKIILDLVLNHSSDEHPWFIEAKKSRDNPYHDFYVWRDGKPGKPPNDLMAAFGGSMWEYVPSLGQYYFHQFSVKQPDLNWHNPALRQELYRMIRFWVEHGAGGFRLDVIDCIAKEPDKKVTAEGKMLHTYVKEMSAAVFQKGDLVTVGEASSATVETAMLWSNPDGSELSMVFQFEHVFQDMILGKTKWDLAPFRFTEFKRIFSKWQTGLYNKGWNSLYFENHDQPRSVSRFGDDGQYHAESAKMLALVLHGMQGTPYVYQGQELGMTNMRYGIEEFKDIETLNYYKERVADGYAKEDVMRSIYVKSRDNARTPMQWTSGVNAGFTEGKPWIKVNPNYTVINAENQMSDADSVFSFYKKLIALRKTEPVLTEGKYVPLFEDDANVFAYTREWDGEKLLVLANFTKNHIEIPERLIESFLTGECLIANYNSPMTADKLRPYEAVMIILRRNKA